MVTAASLQPGDTGPGVNVPWFGAACRWRRWRYRTCREVVFAGRRSPIPGSQCPGSGYQLLMVWDEPIQASSLPAELQGLQPHVTSVSWGKSNCCDVTVQHCGAWYWYRHHSDDKRPGAVMNAWSATPSSSASVAPDRQRRYRAGVYATRPPARSSAEAQPPTTTALRSIITTANLTTSEQLGQGNLRTTCANE